ncbi:CDP-alcohol phosphatidyltransferase family protein [Shumkonia mesophila]|uniref:CDP-alcohol phosphatidyltransferase family protein n=1 Tax=Shumkonia mesophila TaxID=2838854 RepID=UPI002934CF7C|nr:CDP-alcohol phosphatidyltransferase family protein [Shumkonia mesophila]
MVGDSWTHKMAHVVILPLVDTPVTPNHITTLRLLTGLAACAAFAVGERSWDIAGGWLWLLSAFLDRADGELARVSGKASPWGHKYDMVADIGVTALFFLGAGIGLRGTDLGGWAILMGTLGAAGVVAAEILAEVIDNENQDTGEKAYPGFAGFDFDDVLYLFAPVVWLGWQMPFVVGAAVGAPAFALLTWYRLRRSRSVRAAA